MTSRLKITRKTAFALGLVLSLVGLSFAGWRAQAANG